ncbi:properdin-like [Pseudophryne corroboree]|uniref:properdin-like n=1 Tax=Pseudophryne corroboree TaxID=495146 RepID=UPI003081EB51
MQPLSLLLLATVGILLTLRANADDVLCFAEVNEETGQCGDYLGDGVPEQDCCLNIKYGFKRDSKSACQACRPAKWGPWGEWSPCTVSCMEGIQQRRRVCIGQGNCAGQDLEIRSCSLQDCCPRQGGWSEWASWSQCSVTCGIGQRQRTRQCDNPPPLCGSGCSGVQQQTEDCNTLTVCPTHGSWGNWGAWGKCSSSCTIEGSGIFPVQSRFRLCNDPLPSTKPLGRPCEGSDRDTRDCSSVPFCPVHGGWGSWQKDSECSVTCGVGRTTEKRSCDNPAPRYGGKPCDGPPNRQNICNTKKPCPVNGEWTEWEPWSPCSRLTEEINCLNKAGNQKRTRECVGTSHDGEWCPGDYRQSRGCYDMEKCFLKGSWSEWSEWGLCSATCGHSEKSRFRECVPKYPDWPLIVDGAIKAVEVVFSGTPRTRCQAIDGQTLKVEEKTECKNVPSC